MRLIKEKLLSVIFKSKIKNFVLDVDGVFTDGSFIYDSHGKKYKRFGPDDADAIKEISQYINIFIVSADIRGAAISEARVTDMGFILEIISSKNRLSWAQEKFDLKTLAYMGDSYLDVQLLRSAELGICPANAHSFAKKAANIVTRSNGGDRAVAEACFYISRRDGLSLNKNL